MNKLLFVAAATVGALIAGTGPGRAQDRGATALNADPPAATHGGLAAAREQLPDLQQITASDEHAGDAQKAARHDDQRLLDQTGQELRQAEALTGQTGAALSAGGAFSAAGNILTGAVTGNRF
jgi:hypothetical protein